MKTIKIRQATKTGYVEIEIGGVVDLLYPSSLTRRGRVQEGGRVSPTVTAEECGLYRIEEGGKGMKYRIRKLTPTECWRLMGFSDEDHKKAEAVCSKTQRYKQAGNSICENVIVAIIGQMIPGKEDVYKTISRREDGSRKPYV